jgi:serine/threonine-protein kinase
MELIHRDLKPDNVLVTQDGNVKVLDFGVARHLDKERLTLSGAVVGTVAYMAPEQVLGKAYEAKPATDVWAMGVMLYELVAGHRPFQGDTNIELMASIMSDQPKNPCKGVVDAPTGLDAVIRLALAKAPRTPTTATPTPPPSDATSSPPPPDPDTSPPST